MSGEVLWIFLYRAGVPGLTVWRSRQCVNALSIFNIHPKWTFYSKMAFEEVLIVKTSFNVLQHLWRINAYRGFPHGRVFLMLEDLWIFIAPFYNIFKKKIIQNEKNICLNFGQLLCGCPGKYYDKWLRLNLFDWFFNYQKHWQSRGNKI